MRVGAGSLKSLPVLAKERGGKIRFDLSGHGQENNPQYLEWAIKLSAAWFGDCGGQHCAPWARDADAKSTEPDIQGTRRCLEMMAAHPRLSAFAMQTVGLEGTDRFALAVVRSAGYSFAISARSASA